MCLKRVEGQKLETGVIESLATKRREWHEVVADKWKGVNGRFNVKDEQNHRLLPWWCKMTQ